jgi:nucleotide-binding universal stress UspA family protein
MSDVLAALGRGVDKRPVTGTATAIACVLGAKVRQIDVSDGADPARGTDRVLAGLAAPGTVLGVLSGTASLHDLCWRVAQRAQKPVVLVPPVGRAVPQTISRVLVPLDATPESATAVSETVGLLARAGVDIVVLHVFGTATVPKFWDQAEHAERAWQAEFIARYCRESGVRLRLRSGEPGEHVLDVAAAEGVDLIALGWSQHLDDGRARTVRRTVRDTDVPVMLVPIVE